MMLGILAVLAGVSVVGIAYYYFFVLSVKLTEMYEDHYDLELTNRMNKKWNSH